MNPTDYQAFTRQLITNLSGDPHVQGLVALGSMAQRHYQPDRYSDHDFFVIVEAGYQADLRQRTDWLPSPERIVLVFQETQHGMKVVYNDAHVLEYAIFDRDELSLARVNAYRVLFDRGGIEAILAHLQQRTSSETPPTTAYLFGQLLTHLLIGVARYQRGERLSGHEFVRVYALMDTLHLLPRYLDAPDKHLLDNLNPYRRFERVFPELGDQLDHIIQLAVPNTALALLDLVATHCPNYPAEAWAVVRHFIEKGITDAIHSP